jgi:hypothetical protein
MEVSLIVSANVNNNDIFNAVEQCLETDGDIVLDGEEKIVTIEQNEETEDFLEILDKKGYINFCEWTGPDDEIFWSFNNADVLTEDALLNSPVQIEKLRKNFTVRRKTSPPVAPG